MTRLARALGVGLGLAGCGAPTAPGDTGASGSEPAFVGLVGGPVFAVAPTPGAQTHPAVMRTGDGWLVAWDQDGDVQQAAAVGLADDGAPEGVPVTLRETGGAGFTTPALAAGDGVDGDGDWYVALRIGGELEVARYRGLDLVTRAGVASGAFGFWTAPDLAGIADGLVIGWWEGDRTAGAPATYPALGLGWDLAPLAAASVVGTSPGTGSPVAVEAHPDGGYVFAWSDQADARTGAIQVVHVDVSGGIVASARVDDVALAYAPSRPALAVADDGGIVVGWRAQDDAQVGYGARLRWLDADLVPLGASVALGLAPDATNRVAIGADGGWLVAAWEEATADGDVAIQVFDRATGAARTGPMRVHDAVAGVQARPAVEVVVGAGDGGSGQGLAIGVAFESGPVGGPPQIQFRRFVAEAR